MVRFSSRWIILSLSVASFLIQSCKVDDDYSMDKLEDVNTDMTLFQKGISIPLGSTDKIRLDTLVNRSGIMDEEFGEYLKTAEDGSYHIRYSGSYDLSEELSSLNVNDLATIIPSIDESWSKYAGIAGKDYDIDLKINKISGDAKLFRKSELDAISSMMGDRDFNVPESVATVYDFLPVNQLLDPIKLPEGIAAIKTVELGPNAAVKVSLSLENPMMSKGSIIPQLNFDADGLVTFKAGKTIDLSSLVLSEKNSYQTSNLFPIQSVDIDALMKGHTLEAKGSIIISGAVTNRKLIAAATGDMQLKIEIELVGLEFADVAFELDPFEYAIDEKFSFGFKEADMPEQVKSLKSVTFDDNSVISLNLNAVNIAAFKGIAAKLEGLVITFPTGMAVEGEGISGNKLSIASADLSTPLSRKLKLKSINLGGSEAGATSYSSDITISGKATVSGIVHTSEIPSDSVKDPGFIASISGKPVISEVVGRSDYSVTLEESFAMPDMSGLDDDFKIELPTIDGVLDIKGNMSIPVIGYMEFLGDKYTVDFPVSKSGESVSTHNSLKFDLNKLFETKPTPEEIPLSITAGIDPSRDCIIRTGDKYSLSADYSLDVPLVLGKNTAISLRDTIIVDSKDAATIINNNAIDLLGSIESTLPLGLDITMSLLDSPNGGASCSVIPLKKPARINIEAASTSEFELNMELNSIEAVQNLYAIVLNIKVKSNGQTLKESDYIKVSLSASLPHGITLNPFE